MRKKLDACLAQMRELETKLQSATAEEREDLLKQYAAQEREARRIQIEMSMDQANRENNETHEYAAQLREFLAHGAHGAEFVMKRETGMTMAGTEAVRPLNIKPMIDNAREDNDVFTAAGCPIETGATGITSWPYAGGVSAKIQNELTAIGDAQKIDISKVSATQQRLTVKVLISNQVLMNSDEDLLAYINKKCGDAILEAINFAACSTAKFGTNFYGGFASAGKQTGTYSTLSKEVVAEMVGKLADKNYKTDSAVLVMGMADYWKAKVTPMDAGSGIMLLQDGKILGIPVIASNAINRTTVKGAVTGHNIGLGLFKFLPCLQHGNARLTIDRSSVSAADVDGVYVVLNADWSMTRIFEDAFVLYSKGS